MNLDIKPSPIGGKGSFAPTNIKSGSKIFVFEGELVNRSEIRSRINKGDENLDDPLQIDDEMFLDLDERSLLINHSCDPNTAIREKVDLIAIRDIKKGEEITFDYSSTIGTNINWTMACNCGSKNCRKEIGNVTTIPKDQLMKYLKSGCLQDFIRKQLSPG